MAPRRMEPMELSIPPQAPRSIIEGPVACGGPAGERQRVRQTRMHAVSRAAGFVVLALGTVAFAAVPAVPEGAEASSPPLHPALLKRVRLRPCEFLAVALGDDGHGRKSCSRLRLDNGDMAVAIVAGDDKKKLTLLKAGRRCPGGFVGPDLRPGKEPRYVSYLEITLKGEDDKTLTFIGWLRMYELRPDGSTGGVIGKGCGAETGGRMRLSSRGWHLVGDRMRGPSD